MSDVLDLLEEANDLYKHYDEERRRLMCEADERGFSATKIAAAMGLASTGTVRSLIAKYRSGKSVGNHSMIGGRA